MTEQYTSAEFMICQAARMIENGRTIFVGYGMPQLAAMLAQRLYAPDASQVYEFGAIAPKVATPFVRFLMADSRNNNQAVAWQNMNQVMAQASTGYIDYGMLGAAQIDPYGNINSTFVGGSYESPHRRFSGSGGGNEVASFCWKTIILMEHEKRRFIEKLDFLTSPGYLDGSPDAREKAGLPSKTGPYRVITSKGLFDFSAEDRRMRLIGVAEGFRPDDVLDDMGFRVSKGRNVEILKPPTEKEFKILRKEIDPDRVILGRV